MTNWEVNCDIFIEISRQKICFDPIIRNYECYSLDVPTDWHSLPTQVENAKLKTTYKGEKVIGMKKRHSKVLKWWYHKPGTDQMTQIAVIFSTKAWESNQNFPTHSAPTKKHGTFPLIGKFSKLVMQPIIKAKVLPWLVPKLLSLSKSKALVTRL